MDISIFLARTLGLYLLIVSIPLIFNSYYIQNVVAELVKDKASYFILSIIILILGILLIISHDIWVADWRVVITVLAWLTFIKGFMWFYYPLTIQKISTRILDIKTYIAAGVVSFFLGLFLVYHSFIA